MQNLKNKIKIACHLFKKQNYVFNSLSALLLDYQTLVKMQMY